MNKEANLTVGFIFYTVLIFILPNLLFAMGTYPTIIHIFFADVYRLRKKYYAFFDKIINI